jgi:hypothetical protein
MEQWLETQVHFFPLPLTQETQDIVQEAIQHYELALAQTKGRLTPAKWTLAYETMRQMKNKLNALTHPSDTEHIWLSYDETWAFSIAVQLYERYLNTLAPSPHQARAAGYCFLMHYRCAAFLSEQRTASDE